MPFLSMFHLLDDDSSRFNLRVPLDNSAVTLQSGLKVPLTMNTNIHEQFSYIITSAGNSAVTTSNFCGLRSVCLQFEFDYSYTS